MQLVFVRRPPFVTTLHFLLLSKLQGQFHHFCVKHLYGTRNLNFENQGSTTPLCAMGGANTQKLKFQKSYSLLTNILKTKCMIMMTLKHSTKIMKCMGQGFGPWGGANMAICFPRLKCHTFIY